YARHARIRRCRRTASPHRFPQPTLEQAQSRKAMRSLPLADELFLVGHDEYSGKPIVNSVILDSGLAGAVIGELLLGGRLVINESRVQVYDPRPYGESVSDAALAEILRQQENHPVRAWVEYLRDDVREMVGRRLVGSRMVEREESRGFRFRAS